MSTLRQPVQTEALAAADGRGRLAGHKILIVGAGQQNYGLEDPPVGNGRAMSRLFAREGARVALADFDATAMGETAQQIYAEGSAAVTIVADVGEPAEIERMVVEARDGMGGLDGVVANVGIVAGWGLDHTSVEDWDRAFAINVRAHYLTCKHALGVMPDDAAIVLISSIAALMPANEAVAYHSSKAALDGLCVWLAKHAAARGIRVNIVAPGLIDTPLAQLELDPKLRELAILLVATRTDAEYEWVQHVGISKTLGIDGAQISAIQRGDLKAACLDPDAQALLRFVSEVLERPRPDDATFAALSNRFPPRQIVELLLVIGSYQMLARLMTTLDLDIDPSVGSAVLDEAKRRLAVLGDTEMTPLGDRQLKPSTRHPN